MNAGLTPQGHDTVHKVQHSGADQTRGGAQVQAAEAPTGLQRAGAAAPNMLELRLRRLRLRLQGGPVEACGEPPLGLRGGLEVYLASQRAGPAPPGPARPSGPAQEGSLQPGGDDVRGARQRDQRRQRTYAMQEPDDYGVPMTAPLKMQKTGGDQFESAWV